MHHKTPVLAVYGATAYTAEHHLLPYLVSHPDADKFKLILAGRNADKLAAVDATIGMRGINQREIVVLKLDDQGGVESLAKHADVIINFAGPYQSHNAQAIISACVKHGTHYLDLCGEVNFMSRMIQHYDFAASKTGAIIVPACGFDSAPGDLSVYHSLRTLQEAVGRGTGIRRSVNYYDIVGTVSGGTLASVAATANAEDAAKSKDEWALLAESVEGKKKMSAQIMFNYSPPARILGAPGAGAWFPGSAIDIPVIRRSWFLSRLAPINLREAPWNEKEDAAKEPRHGEVATFEEAFTRLGPFKVTGTLTAYLYSAFLFIVVGLYTTSTIVRDAMAKWIPQPGEGPTKEACEAGHTRCTTVAAADDGKHAVLTKYTGKGDPGYSHTGKIIAEAALSLILPPPAGTELPPLARTGGMLTPSTAMGMVLIERLRHHGVAVIESSVSQLARPGEAKKEL